MRTGISPYSCQWMVATEVVAKAGSRMPLRLYSRFPRRIDYFHWCSGLSGELGGD